MYGYFPYKQVLRKLFLQGYNLPEMPVKSSRQGEFHPKPLTEPYVIVSHHTAPVIRKVKLHESHAANV